MKLLCIKLLSSKIYTIISWNMRELKFLSNDSPTGGNNSTMKMSWLLFFFSMLSTPVGGVECC